MDEEMDFKVDLSSDVKIKSERSIFDFSTYRFEPIQTNFEDDPANEEVFCTFEDNKNFLRSTNKPVNHHFIVDTLDSKISSSNEQPTLKSEIKKETIGLFERKLSPTQRERTEYQQNVTNYNGNCVGESNEIKQQLRSKFYLSDADLHLKYHVLDLNLHFENYYPASLSSNATTNHNTEQQQNSRSDEQTDDGDAVEVKGDCVHFVLRL